MRIAALYDIHGNLPALEAVLGELRSVDVDEIIVGGDVVPGPMARESLALLASVRPPVSYVLGNSEVAVLAEMSGSPLEPMPEQARAIIRWTARKIGSEALELFASWPRTLRRNIPGLGSVLFCHGTPRHENEIFTRGTSERALQSLFASVAADVVVCGHTHMQFDRRIGAVRVVNAGSVGMPFGKPGANWLLLGRNIALRHTSYDLHEAAARIALTAYPEAAAFASHSILAPPSEATMLELFARAELRYGTEKDPPT